MFNTNDLNMLPNRKTRTRIAVVATDANGDKTYYRSVGAAARASGISASRIKTMAITKLAKDGTTFELVPASTIEEYLPKTNLHRHTRPRERRVTVSTSISSADYSKVMEIAVSTGISRSKLLRAAIENFLKEYED